MLSQFAAYQDEILAGFSIVIVIILYIIFKKKQKKEVVDLEIKAPVDDEYDSTITDKIFQTNDIYDTPQATQEETSEEPSKTSEETQESSPAPQEISSAVSNREKETPQNKPTEIKESNEPTFTKRSVPPHAKITKDDFKKFAGKRLLLAEDNLINQKVILALLAQSGIEVVVANDGQEAIEILKQDKDFMMILMDAHMPNIDGFEATRIIRRHPEYNHIVIVALSGDTVADDVNKMKDAGMSEHLEKPLNIDALYDTLYAYDTQVKEASTKKESYESAVLDIEQGLDICGGDNAFYTDILNEFLKNYGSSDTALTILLREKKYTEADMLLLDIIGVSGNIGANAIKETAQTAKDAIKRNELDNLSETLHTYKEILNKTIESIKNYLAS
jgi:CheY-like chemotaxis protein